jgi:hypothetical protein
MVHEVSKKFDWLTNLGANCVVSLVVDYQPCCSGEESMVWPAIRGLVGLDRRSEDRDMDISFEE